MDSKLKMIQGYRADIFPFPNNPLLVEGGLGGKRAKV
jgi:hypothetical protein